MAGESKVVDEHGHGQVGSYLLTFVVLAGLTVANIALSFVDMPGPRNLVVAMGISALQAATLALFFMHLRGSNPAVWVMALSSLVFLSILFLFVLIDYFTRKYGAI